MPVNISTVLPNTAAQKAGFQAGDRILKADKNTCDKVFDTPALIRYISKQKPGAMMTFVVYRENKEVVLPAILQKRPNLAGDVPTPVRREIFFENWLRDATEEQKMLEARDTPAQ